jgi:hypothetical protein
MDYITNLIIIIIVLWMANEARLELIIVTAAIVVILTALAVLIPIILHTKEVMVKKWHLKAQYRLWRSYFVKIQT